MTPKIQLAYYALWIAHPVLQLAVAAVMFRRKLNKVFPVFFTYILSQILIFAILFPIYLKGSYFAFFWAYWISAAVSLALGFKVIHEVFLDVFRPYHTLSDLGSVLFKWAGLVMLLVAIVVAASSVTDEGPLVQAVLTVQRCVRVVQCGLVLFLLVFSKYLGVSKRQHSFGVALGFGSFAGVELLVVALRASSYVSETVASVANMVAYNAAILVWFGYLLAKDVARESAAAGMLTSQRWDQGLTDLQRPGVPDSLIPMFEGMVDRALSRNKENSFAGRGEAAEEEAARELIAHRMSDSER